MKFAYVFCSFLVGLAFGKSAEAVPNFETGTYFYTPGNTLLVRDSDDTNLYYYLSYHSPLVRNESNKLRFSLAYWGISRDSEGHLKNEAEDSGGVLAVTFESRLNEEQLREARAVVGSQAVFTPLQGKFDSVMLGPPTIEKQYLALGAPSAPVSPDAYLSLNALLTGIGTRQLIEVLESKRHLRAGFCFKTQIAYGPSKVLEDKAFCIPLSNDEISNNLKTYVISADGVEI